MPRTVSQWVLKVSKEGGSTTSLGNLCHCSPTHWKKFADVQEQPLLFQLMPIASCLGTEHLWKETYCVTIVPFCHLSVYINEVLWASSSLCWRVAACPPFLVGEIPQSLKHLCQTNILFEQKLQEVLFNKWPQSWWLTVVCSLWARLSFTANGLKMKKGMSWPVAFNACGHTVHVFIAVT